MKRLIGTMAIALGFALSGGAHAGTALSSHDFTDNCKGKSGNSSACTNITEVGTGGWNTRGEICRVCHVPHDHQRDLYKTGLLWNHAVSAQQAYTLYDSSTMDTNTQQPTGRSKMCLGCHDGTVAVSAFDSNHLTGGATPVNISAYKTDYIVPGALAPANLSGTHPISIPFPDPLADPNFVDPAGAFWIGGISVASTLDNGLIQCSTCHDVHAQNYAVGAGTGPVDPITGLPTDTHSHLLRQAQTTSQGGNPSGLCLTCHIK